MTKAIISTAANVTRKAKAAPRVRPSLTDKAATTAQAVSMQAAVSAHDQALAAKLEFIHATSLTDIRNAYASVQGEAREANMAYAAKLNEVMPSGWYSMLGNIPQRRDGITDKAELAIFDERVAHHATIRARLGNGANPSPNWKRVANYASELATGARDVLGNLIKKVERGDAAAQVGGEGGAAGNVNPSRSPTLRNIEELVKLYKANSKVEGDKKIEMANEYIRQALLALGCDVRLQK